MLQHLRETSSVSLTRSSTTWNSQYHRLQGCNKQKQVILRSHILGAWLPYNNPWTWTPASFYRIWVVRVDAWLTVKSKYEAVITPEVIKAWSANTSNGTSRHGVIRPRPEGISKSWVKRVIYLENESQSLIHYIYSWPTFAAFFIHIRLSWPGSNISWSLHRLLRKIYHYHHPDFHGPDSNLKIRQSA